LSATGRKLRTLLLSSALAAAVLAGLSGEPAGGSDVVSVPNETPAPVMYLTFDDGPHWLFTPMLLDLLDRYGARVSFFPTAEAIVDRWDAATTRDLLNRGHTIGNHTWHHSDLSRMSADEAFSEVAMASSGLERLMGFSPTCFRAPYGEVGEIAAMLGPRLGMSLAGWTADPQEWRDPPIQDVMSYLHGRERDGLVVLFHDRKWLTLHIVEQVLKEYSDRGWVFDALPACMSDDLAAAAMHSLAPGDAPAGRVNPAQRVSGGTLVTGWAFDADLPAGGLYVRYTIPGSEPLLAGPTGVDHRFEFQVDSVSAGDDESPVCLWAVNAGPRRHDASLGCLQLPEN